jgi:hypothetical protein
MNLSEKYQNYNYKMNIMLLMYNLLYRSYMITKNKKKSTCQADSNLEIPNKKIRSSIEWAL